MSRKLTPIVRLNGAPRAEAWIRRGKEDRKATIPKADIFTARLTVDVTPELRGRIKVADWLKMAENRTAKSAARDSAMANYSFGWRWTAGDCCSTCVSSCARRCLPSALCGS